MFFELHDENRIGYKALTNADIGRAETTHQTHIGLFDDVLTFLPNSSYIKDAMAIYDERAEILSLHFDRIKNPDGTFRSPKIRAGQGGDSVFSFVRRTVKNVDPNGVWYLFWFGLMSKQPVFLFFNEGSKTYADLCNLGIDLHPRIKGRLDPSHSSFIRLINYLERIVNVSGTEFAEELELIVQAGKRRSSSVRKYNFDKAYKRSLQVGREGETLVDRFFAQQKIGNLISDYVWMNREGESGLSYDFWYETLSGQRMYLDVKTTDYRFEQKMIFSNQEVAFASEHVDQYCVYRIYCDERGERFLKICTDTDGVFIRINIKTDEYKSEIVELAGVQSIKLAVSPAKFSLNSPGAIKLSSHIG